MKTALALVFGAILVAIGLFVHMVNEDDRQRERNAREWVQFSQQHHCKVVRDESFSNPTTLWECDGNWQVRR